MRGYGDENTLHVIFSWKEVAKLIVLVDEGVKVVKKWKIKDEKTRRRVHDELDKFRDELIEIAKNATVKPETHKLSDQMECPECKSQNVRLLGMDYYGYPVYICDDCKHVFQTVQYCQDIDSGNLYALTDGSIVRVGAI